MSEYNSLPPWKDKALFTPGPLTTSQTVKQAMLRDLGSRDAEFVEVVADVRRRLVALGCATPEEFTAVLVQGSGTYGLEGVISSVIPHEGKLLVLINGAYGERMLKMAEIHHIPVLPLRVPEDQTPEAEAFEQALVEDPTITHVAVVHCETTTGILNPVEVYAEIVRRHGRSYIVDAMSSFGAYTLDLPALGIDYLVSSANKCLEGVPGFAFVLARKPALGATRGWARTLSLDLLAQWEGLEKDGQFRFTPPTHTILAFQQALDELDGEGGIPGRAERYRRNHHYTLEKMEALGFQPYLDERWRSYIITSFLYPDHANFNFAEFYQRLSDKSQVIYPGKLSHADCFRIGHIGRLDLNDVRALIGAIEETLVEMKVNLTGQEA